MKLKLEEVFLEAFERNKDSLYRIACSYTSDYDSSQDLFQEILFNIWKSLPSYRQESSIDTWIYRIAINICLRSKSKADKNLRTFKKLDHVELENFQEHINRQSNDSNLKLLFECIKDLNKSDKSIILLYLEELPYKEIAQITGLTENHVAVKVKRVKAKLSNCINTKRHG